jgi:hypothetical protein
MASIKGVAFMRQTLRMGSALRWAIVHEPFEPSNAPHLYLGCASFSPR